jgi:hypothetical protein
MSMRQKRAAAIQFERFTSDGKLKGKIEVQLLRPSNIIGRRQHVRHWVARIMLTLMVTRKQPRCNVE